jgi:hypothetical protein
MKPNRVMGQGAWGKEYQCMMQDGSIVEYKSRNKLFFKGSKFFHFSRSVHGKTIPASLLRLRVTAHELGGDQ